MSAHARSRPSSRWRDQPTRPPTPLPTSPSRRSPDSRSGRSRARRAGSAGGGPPAPRGCPPRLFACGPHDPPGPRGAPGPPAPPAPTLSGGAGGGPRWPPRPRGPPARLRAPPARGSRSPPFGPPGGGVLAAVPAVADWLVGLFAAIAAAAPAVPVAVKVTGLPLSHPDVAVRVLLPAGALRVQLPTAAGPPALGGPLPPAGRPVPGPRPHA